MTAAGLPPSPRLRPVVLPGSTRSDRCVIEPALERSRSSAVLVSYRRVSTQARKKQPRKTAPAPIKPAVGPPAHERRGRRESRVDQAYAEIRRRILDNYYAPGHQVLEHELAAELGMSRTPVREALVRLQNERFVQLIPRHGMRVVPLSIQELREVYEVLTSLELTAIDRLARLDLEEEALATIEKTVDAMDQAVRTKDVDAWAKADERFHRILVTLCGNRRLAAMVEMLWEQGHRARMTTVRLRASLEQSNREHRALLDAIRQRDWRQARARHAKHRQRAMTEILNLLHQTRLGSF
jgi:DNA-binding GntR family transcriptional regulator